MTLYAIQVETPIGRFVIAGTDAALVALSPAGPAGDLGESGDGASVPLLERAWRELGEYFAGLRRSFDLPLAFRGSPFQRAVWSELLAIPFGETSSYGALARRLGRLGAARAVGAANGKNPIPILVPCHRVLAADGSLAGYALGEEKKRWLLEHERRVADRKAATDGSLAPFRTERRARRREPSNPPETPPFLGQPFRGPWGKSP